MAGEPIGSFEFREEIVWRPSEELMAQSNLKAFMDKHRLSSLEELQRKSTEDLAWFWDAVLKDLEVKFSRPYEKVVDITQGVMWPKWCVGGQLNIVHNLLDKHAKTPIDSKLALKWEGEEGKTAEYTYAQLRTEVNKVANALRSLGIGKNDVVGVFMPMTPECVAAMLGIIKIGAIFLPLFSGFGAGAVVTRLRDTDAKALITVDGYYRRGNVVDILSVAKEVAAQVPTLKEIIVHHRLSTPPVYLSVTTVPRLHWWHEYVSSQPVEARAEMTDAEDVCMVIYTSGTTGKPKGAVHTHCGFAVKAAQDMRMGLDLHPDETLFWVTDIGWMMGPWLIFGTLLNKATMMIYDGALDFPANDRLWDLVEKHKVTALGVSPTLIRSLARHGDGPVRGHDLSTLRKFGSTGEPWNPEPWRWLFEVVGASKLPIINYSGGTETSGGILMGNVLSPMKPCAFSGPVPGMAAEVVSGRGQFVREEVGELVICQPWIGMTRGFWRDPQRYEETYWSRLSNMWVHGDWAAVDADGLWYILGRSDDTIKIAGKRLGPAEVESILVEHPSVAEAAAIGVPDVMKGEELVCFCVLKPGVEPTEPLRKELKEKISTEMGKAYAAKDLKFVTDLPKTRNAKVMRRLVRAAYLEEPLGDTSALENPTALDEIKKAC